MMKKVLPKALSGVGSLSFFGFGKSTVSLLGALPLDGITVKLRSEKKIDKRLLPSGLKVDLILDGEAAFTDIDEDLIIASPSLRRERKELEGARAMGVKFTSDAELFFEEKDESPVIGITGSDGKSTTATLVHQMLSGVRKAALIGNVGAPMYEALTTDSECYVAELSSFMLRYAKADLECAAITSLTPNHLNWHESLDEYKETKLSILKNAKRCVLSADSPLLPLQPSFALTSAERSFDEIKNLAECEYYFTYSDGFIVKNGKKLISIGALFKRDICYIKNCLTALAVCEGIVPLEDRLAVISSFRGLAHRCERFLAAGGIDFINSSIDTTPARCKATLWSIKAPVVLILGGRGKGASYSELIPSIRGKVRTVIATGEDSPKILKELSGTVEVIPAFDFREAVLCAIATLREGDTLLLSPAATSYDAFSSFEERGELFKRIVNSLFGN